MLAKWRQEGALWVLLTGAIIGLVASFVLSIESLLLAKSAGAVLSCDLNAVLSCSSVAKHWSAQLLGFPNSFIGLITLPVVITIAVALLAKASFPKWFLQAAQVGAVAGLLFAIWMFYMSFIHIGALCPWCLTLDVGMVFIFFGMMQYMALRGMLIGGERWGRVAKVWATKGYGWLVMWSVLVLGVVAIIAKFGSELF